MKSTSSTAVSAAFGSLLLGCGLVIGGEPPDRDDPIADDIAEYQQLVAELEAEREQALTEEVTAISTAGPWLAWLDQQSLGLRRYPDRLELALPAPDPSYRLGVAHVITAERSGDALHYRSYALPDGQLQDEHWFAAPEQGWSLYGLLDDVALVLDTDEQAIWRWQVGVEQPMQLGTLADAGIFVTELVQLEALTHEDHPLLFVHADARLWALELASLAGSELAEADALLAVDARGLLYTHAGALYLHQLADAQTLRIDMVIAASGWSLNQTFADIHSYAGEGASLLDDRVIYIGRAGVFVLALDRAGPESITPLLIEPRWDVAAAIPRIEYRQPHVAGGHVFVRGLIGEHGEIGERGPIFAVPN